MVNRCIENEWEGGPPCPPGFFSATRMAFRDAGRDARHPGRGLLDHFFCLLYFVICLLVLSPPVLWADNTAPNQEDVNKEKLSAIQKEIDSLRTAAGRLSQQEQSVLTLLDQYNIQLRMETQELQLLGMRQATTEIQIRDLSGKFDVLQKSLDQQKAYLSKRLVDAYKLGRLNYLKLLLQVNTASNLLRSYQYVNFLAKDDGHKVEIYRDSLQQMEETRIRLEQENRNLIRLRQDSEQAHIDLVRNREEKVRLLTAIQGEKEVHLGALSELRVAAVQLKRLFAPPESVTPPAAQPSGATFARMKGVLDWPLRGRVILNYGPQRHPRFGTITVNNGIEISANEGAEVNAVADGTVVFAEWFKGYGRLVILSHSGGYYTLYAHDSQIMVTRGDSVRQGQVIARAGDTGGTLNQPTVYFEIRYKDQPIDPMTWLRK
jgi:septal ring factor EnvC (AmiA/AmiB activator)